MKCSILELILLKSQPDYMIRTSDDKGFCKFVTYFVLLPHVLPVLQRALDLLQLVIEGLLGPFGNLLLFPAAFVFLLQLSLCTMRERLMRLATSVQNARGGGDTGTSAGSMKMSATADFMPPKQVF